MKKIVMGLMVLLLIVVGCGNNEDKANEEVVEITEEVMESDSEESTAAVTTEEETDEELVVEEEKEDSNLETEAAKETTTDNSEATDNSEFQDYIDIELTDIDGKNVRLSDYEGKFIVLNFFGVWCHYCMEEMPDLEKVYSEYEGDDLVIFLVNATTTEKIGKEGVIEWYNKGLEVNGEIIPITMPMAMDLDGSALEVYPVSGFPTSYFISKEGKVLGAIPGMLDEATLLSIIQQYN